MNTRCLYLFRFFPCLYIDLRILYVHAYTHGMFLQIFIFIFILYILFKEIYDDVNKFSSLVRNMKMFQIKLEKRRFISRLVLY